MDIFLSTLRISLSNFVVTNIVHILTFIYKNLQHNFIKLGWGVKSTAIFIKLKKETFFTMDSLKPISQGQLAKYSQGYGSTWSI